MKKIAYPILIGLIVIANLSLHLSDNNKLADINIKELLKISSVAAETTTTITLTCYDAENYSENQGEYTMRARVCDNACERAWFDQFDSDGTCKITTTN